MQVSTHPGLEVSACLIKESRRFVFRQDKVVLLQKTSSVVGFGISRNRRVSCHDEEEVLLLIHMTGGWATGETRAKHAAAVGGL